jgi:Bacteriocin-protection, YdeI or OmpD-Associated/Domain of unknown function (DUF1905)
VTTQRFETTLWRPEGEGSSTFIRVPLDVRAAFGRARPPVLVTVNGYTYRSTIAVYGGRSYLPVNKEHREKAGVAPGDTVTVELAPDADPRDMQVPEDLGNALDRDPAVRALFDALSYSHRREYLIWVDGAKRPETRHRRVTQTIERLRRGERLKS